VRGSEIDLLSDGALLGGKVQNMEKQFTPFRARKKFGFIGFA